ncbi:hypothetical protein TWF506_008345 [Arthrobotrys conoides]|uniref:Uncharacterized protein n=1 Tax=Arthrobotrys conoides TaxID=74498 RepID=A0AAN8PFL0_9PEZI
MQAESNQEVSLEAVDGSNDDEEHQIPEFHSREAARIVLNPGKYMSKPEPEPVQFWTVIPSTSPAAALWDEKSSSAMDYLSEKGDLIKQELRESYFTKELFPEIVFDRADVQKEAILEVLGDEYYSGIQPCGASIGVKGVSWSAGTVGGYFESEAGDIYGITCHHVLLPTRKRSISENSESEIEAEMVQYPKYLDTIGLHHSAFDPKDGDIEVAQPPCGDHTDTINRYRAQIISTESRLEALKAKYEALGVPVPDKQEESWTELAAEYANRLATIISYDRNFGTLAASSGYRIDPELKHSIDWALFKISDGKLVLNMIRAVEREKGQSFWSGRFKGYRTKLQGIADPVEDKNVFKIGRGTGITFGVISGIRSGVYFKENPGVNEKFQVVGFTGHIVDDRAESKVLG